MTMVFSTAAFSASPAPDSDTTATDRLAAPFVAPFVMVSGEECLIGLGAVGALPPVPRAELASMLPGYFTEAVRRGGPPILVGALPFDAARPVHLFQPRRVERRPERLDGLFATPDASGPSWSTPRWRLRADPPAEEYAANVAAALALMEAAPDGSVTLRKAVLSRSLVLESDRPLDIGRLLKLLRHDHSVTTYAVPLPSEPGGDPRVLIGATPELLLEKTGARVRSTPLAGSARRRPDPRADRAAAAALMASDKDRREHATVVEAILDGLAPYCRDLNRPEPEVVSTATMWHLGTRIEGSLRDPSVSSLELAAVLHPTPAVCGFPRDRARAVIGDLEGFDRGFFSGAVGWCDERGDGRWLVAIRCAELSGRTARLYAGAGIVPGSVPQSEVAETDAKFTTMLNALQVGDDVITPFRGAA